MAKQKYKSTIVFEDCAGCPYRREYNDNGAVFPMCGHVRAKEFPENMLDLEEDIPEWCPVMNGEDRAVPIPEEDKFEDGELKTQFNIMESGVTPTEFTHKVIARLRVQNSNKINTGEIGNYADRMMLVKLITMRSVAGFDEDRAKNYGSALYISSDLGVYAWNFNWLVHKAPIQALAMLYGRAVLYDDLPVLEQYNQE